MYDAFTLTHIVNLQGCRIHLPMFPIIKVDESSQFNTPDKVICQLLLFGVYSVINIAWCLYIYKSLFCKGGNFTPPLEILQLACYSLNDYLISYILQILSFTSVQLNKSDVDMKGAVTEKVHISLNYLPIYDVEQSLYFVTQ